MVSSVERVHTVLPSEAVGVPTASESLWERSIVRRFRLSPRLSVSDGSHRSVDQLRDHTDVRPKARHLTGQSIFGRRPHSVGSCVRWMTAVRFRRRSRIRPRKYRSLSVPISTAYPQRWLRIVAGTFREVGIGRKWGRICLSVYVQPSGEILISSTQIS